MSATAVEVPDDESRRLSSPLPDANDTEHDETPSKFTRSKKNCVSPSPSATAHTVSSSLNDGNTGGFSLVRLLRSLALPVSLVLENTGSVARDHLANERTWLAYVRTSLSIAGTGVALVQLFTISESMNHIQHLAGSHVSLRSFARPLGATTVMLALCILGIGVFRFFKIQSAMARGLFPAARTTIVFITAVLAALVAVTFGVLVALPS